MTIFAGKRKRKTIQPNALILTKMQTGSWNTMPKQADDAVGN